MKHHAWLMAKCKFSAVLRLKGKDLNHRLWLILTTFKPLTLQVGKLLAVKTLEAFRVQIMLTKIVQSNSDTTLIQPRSILAVNSICPMTFGQNSKLKTISTKMSKKKISYNTKIPTWWIIQFRKCLEKTSLPSIAKIR